MENKQQPINDLRSSARYRTDHIPLKLISNDIFYGIPARLNNFSSGGLQVLCSHYSAQQLLQPKNPMDDQDPEAKNILVEILNKDDSKHSELSCKLVYIHQNHSPNDYCSDAVGLEVLMDNSENRRILYRYFEKILKFPGTATKIDINQLNDLKEK